MKPIPKMTSKEGQIISIGWVLFICGMGVIYGPGGVLVGIGLPIMLGAACDRVRVINYDGKEDEP